MKFGMNDTEEGPEGATMLQSGFWIFA